MEGISQYLLTVVSAGIICAICSGMISKKGTYAAIIKLLTGLLMLLTMLAPLTKLNIQDLTAYFNDLSFDGTANAQAGEAMAVDATESIIKENVKAYILDKASALGLDVEVDIALTEDTPPLPRSVTVTGAVSPYAKQVLTKVISDDLGIPEEQQLWK